MNGAAGFEIVEEDIVWARHEGADLVARVYRPEASSGTRNVVVDVHGGVWTFGDRTTNAVYNRGLAERGVVVVAIDFRDGRTHRHPAGSIDVTNAVRWARLHASTWDADSESVGLIG